MTTRASLIGTVQDVQGASVSIALEKSTVSGLAFIDGRGYRVGQIGSFVRIPIGFTDLYGLVSHVGAGAVPETLAESEPFGYRWLKVQLIGEAHRYGEFARGVSQYPTIGDEAHLVTDRDLFRVYGRQSAGNYVRVGSIASADSIPALVDVDRLVTRHSAVVGATGAGKSTTVAGLLASLTDPARFPSSRVIVLDIHGEYHSALSDRATVFRVNAREAEGQKPLYVPYWALTLDELLRVTPFRGLQDADRAGVVEKIKQLKLDSLRAVGRKGTNADSFTVDTPIPFSVHRLWYELHRFVCSTHTAQQAAQSEATEAVELDAAGNQILGEILDVRPPKYRPITAAGPNRVFLNAAPLNIRRNVLALESLLRDSRYDFLFRPGPWCPQSTRHDPNAQPEADLDELLKQWIGGDRPITILDLSGVPISILIDLVGVVLRLLFDALFWSRSMNEGGRKRPLLIVLEEAHAYLNAGNDSAAALAARRIVKEGRKYGLGAMVVSQRPAEIDATILSQCGTTFAMRLANSIDRGHVRGTATDNLEGLFNMLPTLRTGEALIVGEAVRIPVRTLVDAPSKNRRPDSLDPKVYDADAREGWNRPRAPEEYGNVLEAWRSERAVVETGNGGAP